MENKIFVVCDTEANSLVNPDKLWVLCCKELISGKIHIFRNLHKDKNEASRFFSFFPRVSCWIGHNFIGYDWGVILSILGCTIDPQCIIDTLVVSRLLNYSAEGGHSLEAIGQRLGYPKSSHSDWSQWSQEMEDYCIRDVEVTYKYYKEIEPFIHSPQWRDSLRLEHDTAILCQEMTTNGFHFNIKEAKDLYKKILQRLESLDQELTQAFPPKARFIKEITPRATKNGTLHSGDFRWYKSSNLTPFTPGIPFSRVEFEPFNPGSPKQIVERLNQAGWKPTEKTKGHLQAERDGDTERLVLFRQFGWKVSEENLKTLPPDAPEAARKLVERLLLDSRRSTLVEWFNAFSESDNRIHGRFHHIGAWTHRMSHSGPNMANIPAHGDSLYATEMRSFWDTEKNNWLVGVDADGIQLRILAHYMDDPTFTESLINGRKEDGTDAHSLNRLALGEVCKDRDTAKTFIYAWLLGAGKGKVAEILGCGPREAKNATANFIRSYPGLHRLKEEIIPRDAARGYFQGLDGRYILCDSEHHMLAGYLQAGEAIVMKHACRLWTNRLRKEFPNVSWWLVNFVHDEWQTEVKGSYEEAELVAKIQAESITQAGINLGVKCPLAGSWLNSHGKPAIGRNWSETH